MKKILIPFFSAGYGHHSFARSISHYLEKNSNYIDIRLFDPGNDLKKQKLNDFYVDSWKSFLKMPSKVSQFLYDIDRAVPEIMSFIQKRYLTPAIPAAVNFLTGYKPDLIMSTHWGCTQLFDLARKEMNEDIPLFYVYTELGGAFKLIRCGADKYFCLSEEAHSALNSVGIVDDKIVDINLVIQPHLLSNLLEKREARRKLKIQEDMLTVLYSNGGEGIGPIMEFINEFYRSVQKAQMLILTGKNEKLYSMIHSSIDDKRIIPFGFLDDTSPIFSAADLLSGKCGTSFTMESIKIKRPLAVTNLGAPNEADNLHYVLNHNFGWYTPNPIQYSRLLNTIIENKNSFLEVQEALNEVPEKNGAEEMAQYCIEAL